MRRLIASLAALAVSASLASAGQTRDGLLQVTVVDQTGGVLPGAAVSILGLDEATKSIAPQPAAATAQGIATFTQLPPGRYAVKAEFDGFDPRVLPDVRVRAGENRQTIALALKK